MTSITRRRFTLLSGLAASAWPVWAHHGWSSFDLDRPLYLEGTVARSRWQNPHAELVVDLPQGMRLPADLAARQVPAQSATVDVGGVLAKAGLPRRPDRRWELELAPLTRLEAWKLAEIKPGATVSAVGFTLPEERGDAIMRVEFLFVGGHAYGLRSNPA